MASLGNKPEPEKNTSESKPNTEASGKEKLDRHVYFESVVLLDVVKELKDQHAKERSEDSGHQKWQLIWTIVAAVLIFFYTLAAIWQGYTVHKQLRMDQRPWIKFEIHDSDPNTPDYGKFAVQEQINGPLTMPVRFTNLGKTPAERLTVFIVVRLVGSGDEPDIPKKELLLPHSRVWPWTRTREFLVPAQGFIVPVIYPTEHTDYQAVRMRYQTDGRNIEINPLTFAEAQALSSKRSYLVLWGVVWYFDVFGTEHRTTFCLSRYIDASNTNSQRCANYGSVDNN
jgi:hypothetical protein